MEPWNTRIRGLMADEAFTAHGELMQGIYSQQQKRHRNSTKLTQNMCKLWFTTWPEAPDLTN